MFTPAPETQWLFTRADMDQTPSVREGRLRPSMERQLRAKGVHLVYRIGDFLRLGQHVLSTAAIFLHRFYMRKALHTEAARDGFYHYEIGAAAVFLACKVEETHKKLPLIVTATIGALDKTPEGSQRFAERSYRTDERHPDHAKWRERILSGEEAMLEALCFDLIVAHPHEVLVTCADQLNVGRPLTRVAWTVLNDCLRDPICIMFDPPVLAAASFKKACALKNVDPYTFASLPYSANGNGANAAGPSHKPTRGWLQVFDCGEDEVTAAFEAISEAYSFHSDAYAAPSRLHAKKSTHPATSTAPGTALQSLAPSPISRPASGTPMQLEQSPFLQPPPPAGTPPPLPPSHDSILPPPALGALHDDTSSGLPSAALSRSQSGANSLAPPLSEPLRPPSRHGHYGAAGRASLDGNTGRDGLGGLESAPEGKRRFFDFATRPDRSNMPATEPDKQQNAERAGDQQPAQRDANATHEPPSTVSSSVEEGELLPSNESNQQLSAGELPATAPAPAPAPASAAPLPTPAPASDAQPAPSNGLTLGKHAREDSRDGDGLPAVVGNGIRSGADGAGANSSDVDMGTNVESRPLKQRRSDVGSPPLATGTNAVAAAVEVGKALPDASAKAGGNARAEAEADRDRDGDGEAEEGEVVDETSTESVAMRKVLEEQRKQEGR